MSLTCLVVFNRCKDKETYHITRHLTGRSEPWVCLLWLVEGEERTVPHTAGLHSAANQAQSVMATTPQAPQSQGCDPVQGTSGSDMPLLNTHTLLDWRSKHCSLSSSGLQECTTKWVCHPPVIPHLSTVTWIRIKGFVWSAGMVREHACPAPRLLRRLWFPWSTARSLTYLWIVMCCLSSTFSSATLLPSLSIMSTSIRLCGGTHHHTLPHTHHWWVHSDIAVHHFVIMFVVVVKYNEDVINHCVFIVLKFACLVAVVVGESRAFHSIWCYPCYMLLGPMQI